MTTTTLAPPTTTAARSPFWVLARIEARLFARSAAAVIWTALLPIAAIIVLGVVPATRRPAGSLDGQSPLEAYLSILMLYVLLMSAVNLLPAALAGYRETGVLRRLSTTPVPPSWLLGAQGLIYLGVGIVVNLIMFAVALCAGVPVPRQIPGLVLSLLLVAAATLAIGLLLTALASTERAANALGALMFFPLQFFAGMWIPRAAMPDLLRTISDVTPSGAGVRAIEASLDGRFPPAAPLLVLVAYTLVCGAVAARRFRWQ